MLFLCVLSTSTMSSYVSKRSKVRTMSLVHLKVVEADGCRHQHGLQTFNFQQQKGHSFDW